MSEMLQVIGISILINFVLLHNPSWAIPQPVPNVEGLLSLGKPETHLDTAFSLHDKLKGSGGSGGLGSLKPDPNILGKLGPDPSMFGGFGGAVPDPSMLENVQRGFGGVMGLKGSGHHKVTGQLAKVHSQTDRFGSDCSSQIERPESGNPLDGKLNPSFSDEDIECSTTGHPHRHGNHRYYHKMQRDHQQQERKRRQLY